MDDNSNGSKVGKPTEINAGPLTLFVDLEPPLVVVTLRSDHSGDEIKFPLTSQEAITLGRALITRGTIAG